jgi:hypothetical protein
MRQKYSSVSVRREFREHHTNSVPAIRALALALEQQQS